MKTCKTSIFLLIIITFSYAAGTLNGTVTYTNKVPKPKAMKLDADPACGAAHGGGIVYDEKFIVKDTKVKNVMVWLKGNNLKSATPESSVILDQIKCLYDPHVFGIVKNQNLLIKNSDPVLHNIHSMANNNSQFNFAMPSALKEKNTSFDKTEEPFYIKCDVHPWMKTWVGVFDHTYFAVTDENGNYTINNIPDGTYEVVFWQERLSNLPSKKYKQTSHVKTITISDGKSTNLDYEFPKPEKIK